MSQIIIMLDVHFKSEEKEAFQHRLKNAHEILTPPGGITINNISLMNTMFDAIEETQVPDTEPVPEKSTQSFLYNGGKM